MVGTGILCSQLSLDPHHKYRTLCHYWVIKRDFLERTKSKDIVVDHMRCGQLRGRRNKPKMDRRRVFGSKGERFGEHNEMYNHTTSGNYPLRSRNTGLDCGVSPAGAGEYEELPPAPGLCLLPCKMLISNVGWFLKASEYCTNKLYNGIERPC